MKHTFRQKNQKARRTDRPPIQILPVSIFSKTLLSVNINQAPSTKHLMYNASSLTRIPESVPQTSHGLSWNDPVNAQTSPSVLDTAPPKIAGPSIVKYNGVDIKKRSTHKPADSISYQSSTQSEHSIPLANADEPHDPSLASTTEAPTVREFRLEDTHLPNPSDWTVSSSWSNDKKTLKDRTVTQLARDWSSLDDASFDWLQAAYQSTKPTYTVRKLAQLLSAAVLSTNPSYVQVRQARKEWSPHQKKVYPAARTRRIFFGEEVEEVTADSPLYGYRYKDVPPNDRTNRAEVNDAVELWMASIAIDPSVPWFTSNGGRSCHRVYSQP